MFLKKAASIALLVAVCSITRIDAQMFKIKFGDFTVTDDKGKSYHYYDILNNKQKVFIFYTLSD